MERFGSVFGNVLVLSTGLDSRKNRFPPVNAGASTTSLHCRKKALSDLLAFTLSGLTASCSINVEVQSRLKLS